MAEKGPGGAQAWSSHADLLKSGNSFSHGEGRITRCKKGTGGEGGPSVGSAAGANRLRFGDRHPRWKDAGMWGGGSGNTIQG